MNNCGQVFLFHEGSQLVYMPKLVKAFLVTAVTCWSHGKAGSRSILYFQGPRGWSTAPQHHFLESAHQQEGAEPLIDMILLAVTLGRRPRRIPWSMLLKAIERLRTTKTPQSKSLQFIHKDLTSLFACIDKMPTTSPTCILDIIGLQVSFCVCAILSTHRSNSPKLKFRSSRTQSRVGKRHLKGTQERKHFHP